jgi:hypothetical protein
MPAVRPAVGAFDVEITPTDPPLDHDGVNLARMRLEKEFRGDLVATGRGEMLTAVIPAAQSAAYVAIERITGTLRGRNGSFVLRHNGTMVGTQQSLEVSVVPGSGTGQLTGLSGSMQIQVTDGNHAYTLEYSLPPLDGAA